MKSAHGAESAARKAKREKEEESNRICKELEDLKQSHERQKGELKARDKELAALISGKEDLNSQLEALTQEKDSAQEKIKALEVNKKIKSQVFCSHLRRSNSGLFFVSRRRTFYEFPILINNGRYGYILNDLLMVILILKEKTQRLAKSRINVRLNSFSPSSNQGEK